MMEAKFGVRRSLVFDSGGRRRLVKNAGSLWKLGKASKQLLP